MKSLARWSHKNILAARIIIIVSHIFITCIACYVGIALRANNQFIPSQFFLIFAGLFGLTFFVSKNVGYRSISFYKRKSLDFAVVFLSFLMIAAFANQKSYVHITAYNSLQGSVSKVVVNPTAKPSAKELRKQFRELKTLLKQNRPTARAIIGAVLVGLFLISVVATLSCMLACNAQEGLAVLVLLAGLTGVFFVVKLLLKPKKDPKKKVSDEATKPANNLG
jgi:hypothetical protein